MRVRHGCTAIFPPLHVARWRYFGASPLRQSTLFRRKIAHPSADARTLPGSEYLHSGTAHRLCGVCAIPPHAGCSGPAADAPRPPALFVVYPVSFIYGASLNACAYRMEQRMAFRLCFAQFFNLAIFLLIASNIVLHVLRVLHVLLTISRRGAHT